MIGGSPDPVDGGPTRWANIDRAGGTVPLPAAFFARDATVVAPELLHKVWQVELDGAVVGARITEVEAYTQDDPASHSFRGHTARNASMFGPPGRLYVYLIYGMHHCANVVTGPAGDGQAVLIRSVVVDGIDPRRTSGPGRLTKALGIDRTSDGAETVIVDEGAPVPEASVTPRIGISSAIDWPRRWVAPWPPP